MGMSVKWLCVALLLEAAGGSLPDRFTYLAYGDIVRSLHQLQDLRPDLVQLYNAQALTSIPLELGYQGCHHDEFSSQG